MAWEPRVPLVLAESVVDFPRINSHILERRETLERAIRGPMRMLGDSILVLTIPSERAANLTSDRLKIGLGAVYRFGFDQARREMGELRHRKQLPALIAETVPTQPYDVRDYLSQHVAFALHRVIQELTAFGRGLDELQAQMEMRDRADRLAHNLVLELVGEVLNAGRTLAALGRDEPIIAARPPARYAMRSEQLDQNTCLPCDDLHGKVVEIGTPEYFDYMPPALCLGRGRCRGLYVFADSPEDFLG